MGSSPPPVRQRSRSPRWRSRDGASTACSSTPRSCTRRAARRCSSGSCTTPAECRPTWTMTSIIEQSVDAIRAPGRRREGHLRAVGRRRLRGGRRAGAQGDRRPAHVRVRRHRAHAGGRGRSGRGDVPSPVPSRPRAREGRRPLPRRHSTTSSTRSASARSSARRSSVSSRKSPPSFRRRPLPRAGHAVPRHHRVGHQGRAPRSSPPQRGRAARRHAVRAGRAAAQPVQGRGRA